MRRVLSRSWRFAGSLLPLVALLTTAFLAPLEAAAQQPSEPPGGARPRLVDRRLGEEEQIRRRIEWFFSTRRAGLGSSDELREMRRLAVEETRQALEAQRLRRSFGIDAEQNWWVSKGPSPSTFGGWVFGNIAGRTPALAADWGGGVLYAGTASGGLWRSDNDGLSWTSVFDQAGTMTLGAVAVDPNDPNVVWAGTGENVVGCESYFGIGLLRSANGGQTWEARNGSGGSSLEDLSSFGDIVVDPRDSGHLLVGGNTKGCTGGNQQSGGLYTTHDAGLTWTVRLADTSVYEIQQDPALLDVYWAATNKGLYKSVDNGVTWSAQTASGLPSGDTGRTELAVAPSDGNVVYALFVNGNSGNPEVWRTANGGASWTLRSSGGDACDGQCWYNMVLRVHNTDPDTVFRGTVHVFRSQDGGASWTDLSNSWGSSQKVHQDTHEFLMHPSDAGTFYVGCDGGIWKTEDGGDSFINRNGNLNTIQFYAVGTDAHDTESICGGAQDNSSLARTTSDVWDLQQVTGDGFVCHVDPVDPSYAYITSYPGSYPSVYRSTTGILGSFSVVTGSGSGISSGDRINWVTPYLLDPSSPNILYLGTHRVYRSIDHGSSWSHVGPDDLTGGSGSLLSLEINRNFPYVLYSGSTSGKVWRTANSGADWTDITTGLPSRSINDVGADPTDPDRAFAVVGGFNTGHLWEWTAEGGWVERGAGLPNVPANSVLLTSSTELFVGTDTGVFRSVDGGLSFTPFMAGLPEGTVVTDLKYDQTANLLTAGTYGRGAWQVEIGAIDPIVIYDSVELPFTELDGDGDGSVEPGETWGVRPKLRNVGGLSAAGVTARLATSTPGVTVLEPEVAAYGDLAPGQRAPAQALQRFSVSPDFPCAETIAFDIVEIASSLPPASYSDRISAFSVPVVDSFEPNIPLNLLDEDFDPAPSESWSHEAVGFQSISCRNYTYYDQWQLASKDAEHGTSYHCGGGPGGSYGTTDHSWLYLGGKDSGGGPGVQIPQEALSATLTVTHWYDTEPGEDGGVVVIDASQDGADVYETLEPVGGYPGNALGSSRCNPLGGQGAFHGSSGGWVTSTFDLAPYLGKRVYLAFVFGSGFVVNGFEGWYVDRVAIDYEVKGAPVCDVIHWPGSVPASLVLSRLPGGEIEASWGPSCNEATLPGQGYSIQAGSLAALAAGGYDHAPLADRCDRNSPEVFTPGTESEYYLVVPSEGGREGGAGAGSSGQPRPQTSTVCGERREAACP